MNTKSFRNNSNFFTVLAYARYLGIRIDRNQAIRIGKLASKIGKARNIPPIDVPDMRYGSVKAHHESCLEESFAEIMGISLN